MKADQIVQHGAAVLSEPHHQGTETNVSEPRPATTLEPQEYLRWLLSLERAADLPSGVRGYLVCVETDGRRRLTPIGDDESVLNLKSNLKSHLQEPHYGAEFFRDLRDFCDARVSHLERQPSIGGERRALVLRSAWEIEECAALVTERIGDDLEHSPLRALLRRIVQLAQAQSSALSEAAVKDDEIRAEVEG